jgi:hypothetical protein
MSVRVDDRRRVVEVDDFLDLDVAQRIRGVVLEMEGHVVIDCHALRRVEDTAVVYLANSLRLAGRDFEIFGLAWPHAQLLRLLGLEDPGPAEDA